MNKSRRSRYLFLPRYVVVFALFTDYLLDGLTESLLLKSLCRRLGIEPYYYGVVVAAATQYPLNDADD